LRLLTGTSCIAHSLLPQLLHPRQPSTGTLKTPPYYCLALAKPVRPRLVRLRQRKRHRRTGLCRYLPEGLWKCLLQVPQLPYCPSPLYYIA
jgi:hypothetical protein